MNRNINIESGDQKGELSHPVMIAEPKRKKEDSSSFLAETAIEKTWTLLTLTLPVFSLL